MVIEQHGIVGRTKEYDGASREEAGSKAKDNF